VLVINTLKNQERAQADRYTMQRCM